MTTLGEFSMLSWFCEWGPRCKMSWWWVGDINNNTKRRLRHEHSPNSRAGHSTGGQAGWGWASTRCNDNNRDKATAQGVLTFGGIHHCLQCAYHKLATSGTVTAGPKPTMQPSPETNKPPSMPNVEYKPEPTADRSLKGYSTFLETFLAHFTTPPELNSWVLPFSNVFCWFFDI